MYLNFENVYRKESDMLFLPPWFTIIPLWCATSYEASATRYINNNFFYILFNYSSQPSILLPNSLAATHNLVVSYGLHKYMTCFVPTKAKVSAVFDYII